MDLTYRYAALAGDLRRLYTRLSEVDDALVELGVSQLAAQLLEVELQLIKAHTELLKLASKRLGPAPREQPARFGDDELPF